VVGLLALATWGDLLIRLLYRPEFSDAGWMVRIFAAGAVVTVINQSAGVLWPALGEFRVITALTIVQVLVMTAAMLIGHAWFGVVGFVVGTTVAEVVMLPIQSVLLARRKLWQPELDLPVLGVAAALIAVGAVAR
jgi:O-antigen/teichoic acid export membrane protein